MRRRALVLLGGVLVLLIWFLLTADRPGSVVEAMAEREAAGKSPLYKHDVVRALYWAAAINAFMVVVLMATVRFWVRPMGPGTASGGGSRFGDRVSPRVFVIGLLVCMIIGGLLRWNFARKGLWWDEMWSVKQAIVGKYDRPDEGTLGEFETATPGRALWMYSKPTNHALSSFLAQMSHRWWKVTWGKETGLHEFSELAIRMPNLVMSLLAIGVLGWWLWSWGLSYGGLAAAGFLAVHPWMVRYSVDARAYSAVVLLTVLGCVVLGAIYRSRRDTWWPWLALGFCQFLLLWFFPASLWLAGGFFLGGVVLVCMKWRDRSSRVAGVIRLGVSSLLGAMLFLQVFMPNILQMGRWFESLREADRHLMNWTRFHETMVYLGTGMMRGAGAGEAAEGIPSFIGMRVEHPFVFWILVLILLGIVFLGVTVLLHRRILAVIMGSVVVGGIVHMVVFAATEQYMYSRFLIYLLVPIVVFAGLGAGRLGEWLRVRRGSLLGVLGTAAPIMLFLALVWPQLAVLEARPYSPSMEIAGFYRALNEKHGEEVLAIGYGLGGRVQQVYLPEARHAISRADIERYLEEANRGKRPVYLFYGYEVFNRVTHPDGFGLIDDSAVFREVAAFPGIEAEFYFRVMAYQGNG
ncbi:MAG: hypothetical protein AAGD22_09175 [Verrucomicrobiota bacterium]